MLKYMKNHVRDLFHIPMAILIKSAAVLTEDLFIEAIPAAWELLLEKNQVCRMPSHASAIELGSNFPESFHSKKLGNCRNGSRSVHHRISSGAKFCIGNYATRAEAQRSRHSYTGNITVSGAVEKSLSSVAPHGRFSSCIVQSAATWHRIYTSITENWHRKPAGRRSTMVPTPSDQRHGGHIEPRATCKILELLSISNSVQT